MDPSEKDSNPVPMEEDAGDDQITFEDISSDEEIEEIFESSKIEQIDKASIHPPSSWKYVADWSTKDFKMSSILDLEIPWDRWIPPRYFEPSKDAELFRACVESFPTPESIGEALEDFIVTIETLLPKLQDCLVLLAPRESLERKCEEEENIEKFRDMLEDFDVVATMQMWTTSCLNDFPENPKLFEIGIKILDIIAPTDFSEKFLDKELLKNFANKAFESESVGIPVLKAFYRFLSTPNQNVRRVFAKLLPDILDSVRKTKDPEDLGTKSVAVIRMVNMLNLFAFFVTKMEKLDYYAKNLRSFVSKNVQVYRNWTFGFVNDLASLRDLIHRLIDTMEVVGDDSVCSVEHIFMILDQYNYIESLQVILTTCEAQRVHCGVPLDCIHFLANHPLGLIIFSENVESTQKLIETLGNLQALKPPEETVKHEKAEELRIEFISKLYLFRLFSAVKKHSKTLTAEDLKTNEERKKALERLFAASQHPTLHDSFVFVGSFFARPVFEIVLLAQDPERRITQKAAGLFAFDLTAILMLEVCEPVFWIENAPIFATLASKKVSLKWKNDHNAAAQLILEAFVNKNVQCIEKLNDKETQEQFVLGLSKRLHVVDTTGERSRLDAKIPDPRLIIAFRLANTFISSSDWNTCANRLRMLDKADVPIHLDLVLYNTTVLYYRSYDTPDGKSNSEEDMAHFLISAFSYYLRMVQLRIPIDPPTCSKSRPVWPKHSMLSIFVCKAILASWRMTKTTERAEKIQRLIREIVWHVLISRRPKLIQSLLNNLNESRIELDCSYEMMCLLARAAPSTVNPMKSSADEKFKIYQERLKYAGEQLTKALNDSWIDDMISRCALDSTTNIFAMRLSHLSITIGKKIFLNFLKKAARLIFKDGAVKTYEDPEKTGFMRQMYWILEFVENTCPKAVIAQIFEENDEKFWIHSDKIVEAVKKPNHFLVLCTYATFLLRLFEAVPYHVKPSSGRELTLSEQWASEFNEETVEEEEQNAVDQGTFSLEVPPMYPGCVPVAPQPLPKGADPLQKLHFAVIQLWTAVFNIYSAPNLELKREHHSVIDSVLEILSQESSETRKCMLAQALSNVKMEQIIKNLADQGIEKVEMIRNLLEILLGLVDDKEETLRGETLLYTFYAFETPGVVKALNSLKTNLSKISEQHQEESLPKSKSELLAILEEAQRFLARFTGKLQSLGKAFCTIHKNPDHKSLDFWACALAPIPLVLQPEQSEIPNWRQLKDNYQRTPWYRDQSGTISEAKMGQKEKKRLEKAIKNLNREREASPRAPVSRKSE